MALGAVKKISATFYKPLLNGNSHNAIMHAVEVINVDFSNNGLGEDGPKGTLEIDTTGNLITIFWEALRGDALVWGAEKTA
jgi:hypothetical protein